MVKRCSMAILGATSTVGRELLRVLEERPGSVERLALFSGPRSAGEKIEFRGQAIAVRAVEPASFSGVQIAFFAAGPSLAAQWAAAATGAGAFVIDSSSAFRLRSDVPLVVPEVNPDALARARELRIVASPGYAAIATATALKPLHDAATLERMVVSTYQPVSGKGARGVAELEKQISDLLNARQTKARVFPHRIAFNAVPQVDEFLDNAYTNEEMKLSEETRRLLDAPALRVSATAVRVPVFYGHGQAVNLTTRKKLTAADARALLRKAPGVKVLDDPGAGVYPMPMLASGDRFTHVGRIREDLSQENGLDLFLCADNVHRGAALNGFQIAELLLERAMV